MIGEQNDQRLLDFILEQLVDPQAFLDKVQKLYACGEEDFDTLLFKDGRIYDRYSFPLMLNGGIAGRVWNFRDVTQNKRAEHRTAPQQSFAGGLDSNRAAPNLDD